MTTREGPLSAMRILVVEDEYYLADDLATALRKEGAQVLGPAGTIDEALLLTDTGVDCVVLDLNLRGDMAFPVADRLEEQGIPFLITTGYNDGSLLERFKHVPRIEKPYGMDEVITRLRTIGSRR